MEPREENPPRLEGWTISASPISATTAVRRGYEVNVGALRVDHPDVSHMLKQYLCVTPDCR